MSGRWKRSACERAELPGDKSDCGMIGIGVIGYGYWGPNLVRNFGETKGCRVVAVSDKDRARLDAVQSRYPSITTSVDYSDLVRDNGIDAIVVATPPATHFDIAMKVLKAGKHLLVEKPMTNSSDECDTLIDEAARCKRILMVDHTFAYAGAVRKIREIVRDGTLGEIYYYDSTRINLGLFSKDASVVWDLAVHDLAIMDFLFERKPVAVSATGISHVEGSPENVAYLTFFFETSTVAHINVNWLAPVKIRQTLISGSKKMIVYNDLEPAEKVKVYDKGITVNQTPDGIYQARVGYRTGDMWAPNIDGKEALAVLAGHFVDCIKDGKKPLTDGECGLRVVRYMEAATKSMKNSGRPVDIES